MKLGLQLGYWGAQPPSNHAGIVQAAEGAGFDTVFTAEAWGSDAFTPLAWWGSSTSRIRLGTSIVQLGGMGARDTNYHADVFRRMGYGDIINDVTKLFRGGHKDQAATAIPDELLDDAAIIGDIDQVRRQIRRWRASGVTMLIVNADTNEQVQRYASLL